jgi:hypothetical protein
MKDNIDSSCRIRTPYDLSPAIPPPPCRILRDDAAWTYQNFVKVRFHFLKGLSLKN